MKNFTKGYWIGIVVGMITMLLFLAILNPCNAQKFYSEISEKQYNRIVSGDLFYEGQVQLTDGNWYKGWIARFPDSNKLRFRSEEDSMQIHLLTNKYVKSFAYDLNDTFPIFVFKEIPITKRRSETKAIELLVAGDINLYIYKTVEKITYTNTWLQKKTEYQMLVEFYLEKDGELYYMEDFERDLSYLIRDKEEFYDSYRKTRKNRRDRDYRDYINVVIAYNGTE